MTGTMDSSPSVNMTCDDEEYLSCQICFMNFDEIERVPKYLVMCHHFFCLPCIKNLIGLVERNEVVCPFCRVSSTISKGRCEKLVTSHVALRLLKVVESLAKANKEKIEQQWCSECKSSASMACQQNKHEIINYPDALNEQSLQLNSQIKEQQLTCNKILEDCHKIQSVNQLVLSCTSWLQSEFSHRNVSNNTLMAQIESLKSPKDFSIHMEEDMAKTLKAIEELKIKFSLRDEDVKAAGSTVLNVLNSIRCAQQESEYLASSDAFDFDSWLKKANIFHWETGNNQSSLKVCVRVLAFVFKLLSGELDNTGSASVVDSSNSGNRRCNGDAIEEERKENNELLASVSGTQQIPKRMSQDHPDDAPLGKKSRMSFPMKRNVPKDGKTFQVNNASMTSTLNPFQPVRNVPGVAAAAATFNKLKISRGLDGKIEVLGLNPEQQLIKLSDDRFVIVGQRTAAVGDGTHRKTVFLFQKSGIAWNGRSIALPAGTSNAIISQLLASRNLQLSSVKGPMFLIRPTETPISFQTKTVDSKTVADQQQQTKLMNEITGQQNNARCQVLAHTYPGISNNKPPFLLTSSALPSVPCASVPTARVARTSSETPTTSAAGMENANRIAPTGTKNKTTRSSSSRRTQRYNH